MQDDYRRMGVKLRDMLQAAVVKAGIETMRLQHADIGVELDLLALGIRIATPKWRFVRYIIVEHAIADTNRFDERVRADQSSAIEVLGKS